MSANLVAIVPARGGSKRYPGKNLSKFLGKPLIWHTIEALEEIATTLVVASDSTKILECASSHPTYGKQVTPLLLESSTTGDTHTALDSVNWMLDGALERWVNVPGAVLGLFLPTAPLRKPSHVEEALQLLTEDVDGVVSMTDYEFPPQLNLTKGDNGFLSPAGPFLAGHTRSQDYKEIWRPNGAFYLHWGQQFMSHRNFFTGKIQGYYMPRRFSVDIDTEADARMAEWQYGEGLVGDTSA